MSDFYVGYAPRAPRSLARFVRAAVVAAAAAGSALAIVLAVSQEAFAPSRFEFGHPRDYAGVLITHPIPLLVSPQKTYVLVGPGKHGIARAVAPFTGHHVELRGTLASHGRDELIEIIPDKIRVTASAVVPDRVPLGPVTLTGEIVDSKCYFGVMNPGAGKVHRDCAVRCISGGLPPALLVRDGRGTLQVVMLAGARDVDLPRALLPYIAEPVTISGDLFRVADRVFLETDLTQLRRE